jgi:hypothetical protein
LKPSKRLRRICVSAKSTSWYGPVPTGGRRLASASAFSFGMITTGAVKLEKLSRKVACRSLRCTTKVSASGASHRSMIAKEPRSTPTRL